MLDKAGNNQLDDESEEVDEDQEGKDEVDKEEEEEGSGAESDDSEPAFDFDFLVLYDGASESIMFTSDTTWTNFRRTLCNKLDVAPKHLCIGYSLTSDSKTSAIKHLSEPFHLIQLFSKANAAKEIL
ncbi:hypothetical protein J3R30DRAFT_2571999 [Lentinula aciculospora]|uniref:Uncharacterized protein n=1 Tax=Lentinula aciculospora TaxID=153920 RepID=A0A9W9DPC4_9AGAR|nr:hypothetical protein J3R30DRAFT_2571999 [Lentinula aciculospora]